MFSSDKNIETISQLVTEIKRYVELKSKAMQIQFVCKLSRLFTAIIVFLVLFMLLSLTVMFLSMMTASALSQWLGNDALAYGIVVLFYLLLATLLFFKRKAWIERPLTNFVAQLFFNK